MRSECQPDDYQRTDWGTERVLPAARVKDRRTRRERPKSESQAAIITPDSVFYAGTRRLKDLPDGRAVFQYCHPMKGWTVGYEVPLLVEQYPALRKRRTVPFPAKSASVVRPRDRHEKIFAD